MPGGQGPQIEDYFLFGRLNRQEMKREGSRGEGLRGFGRMSKLGLPYLPSTLVWTKISLDKYSIFYPTYLSNKFGHFENKGCS